VSTTTTTTENRKKTLFNRSCVLSDCGPWVQSVSGFTGSGCNCTCRGQAIDQCMVCPPQYDQVVSSRCSFCAAGFNTSTYPNCFRLCTQQNCSFRATRVTGDASTGCRCVCANYYSQPACATCPVQYDSISCSQCASGYSGIPPDCKVSCTIAGNCSGNAVSVVGQAAVRCNCTCFGGWSNATCGFCPSNWNPDTCTTCAAGFGGPTCVACTQATCNYNAESVVPDASGCRCICAGNRTGITCDSCPVQYDPSQGCMV